MKPYMQPARHRAFGVLTILLAAFALLAAGCNEDEISKLPEAQGGGPLYVQRATGGTININGTNWVEPCQDRSGSGTDYFMAFMTMGALGSRTEVSYGTDPACTASIGSETFNFVVSNDGVQPTTTWVDDTGAPTTPPSGHAASYPTTKVTISGNDSSGPFFFKTLLFYDDLGLTINLIFGDNESGLNLDGQGYPTAMFTGGAQLQ